MFLTRYQLLYATLSSHSALGRYVGYGEAHCRPYTAIPYHTVAHSRVSTWPPKHSPVSRICYGSSAPAHMATRTHMQRARRNPRIYGGTHGTRCIHTYGGSNDHGDIRTPTHTTHHGGGTHRTHHNNTHTRTVRRWHTIRGSSHDCTAVPVTYKSTWLTATHTHAHGSAV